MSDSHAHSGNHGSVKSYITGFILAVILTAIPFWMVMSGSFTRGSTLCAILVLAIVQIIVHLKYFLHLNFTKKGKLDTFTFLFTALIIVMVVGLSIWIITSADILMERFV